MKRYNHGFILGKFMPLHNGHIYLLEIARAQCKELTILVCTQPDDPISGDLRFEWVKKQFPKAEVVHHPVPLPRDQSNPHFWELWRESIEKYCPRQKFDVVFSSESYGSRLAKELKAEYVEVDLQRKKFPVSGTDIRGNPKKYQQFIPDIVKPYYKGDLS